MANMQNTSHALWPINLWLSLADKTAAQLKAANRWTELDWQSDRQTKKFIEFQSYTICCCLFLFVWFLCCFSSNRTDFGKRKKTRKLCKKCIAFLGRRWVKIIRISYYLFISLVLQYQCGFIYFLCLVYVSDFVNEPRVLVKNVVIFF